MISEHLLNPCSLNLVEYINKKFTNVDQDRCLINKSETRLNVNQKNMIAPLKRVNMSDTILFLFLSMGFYLFY